VDKPALSFKPPRQIEGESSATQVNFSPQKEILNKFLKIQQIRPRKSTFALSYPPSTYTHRPHLILLSTQISNSEKTFEQYAESFTTPVGSRVVLDTSVLVADPNCLHSFPNCAIVIPLTVIEELDGLKTRMDDVGRSARSALRSIEDLRRKAGGSLKDPTPVNGNDSSGTVQIEVNGIQHHLLIEHGLDPKVPDNRIIGAALGQASISPTCVVSNDAALRIKAAHLGLTALEHRPVSGGRSEKPMGWSTFDTSVEVIDTLYKAEGIEKSQISQADGLYENNFAVLR
jgi:PhoH-like ATPase